MTFRRGTGPSRPVEPPTIPGCALVPNPRDVCPHVLEGVLSAVAKKWSV